VGDRFTGWFGDGATASPKVVATYTRGLGLGAVVLPGNLLRQHTASPSIDSVLVSTAPAHRDATTRALGRVAAALPGATVSDGATVRTQTDADVDRNAWVNQLIGSIIIGYAVIAAANTLIATTLARRRDIALLRLSGMTHRQGARVLGLERLLLAGIAVAVSAVTSLALLLPGLRSTVGDVSPYLPLRAWAAAGLLVATLVLVAFVPTQRVLRSRPIEAVGVRE
jgi:putative ABC transport system permease protein